MTAGQLDAHQLAHAIDQLEQTGRQRALTADESQRLDNLLYRRSLRQRRLAGQIERARARLAELEAQAA